MSAWSLCSGLAHDSPPDTNDITLLDLGILDGVVRSRQDIGKVYRSARSAIGLLR